VITRIVTAIAITGLCGFAVFRGRSIVEFSRANQASDARGETMRAWIGAPGVTTAALDAALGDIATASDLDTARQRADLLTQLLSARPLSSITWLSLAGMRLVTGRPFEDVLAALKMSSITGPNEVQVMWQRGMFCLIQWEVLPPDVRQQAIVDLAGPIDAHFLDDGALRLIQGLLAAKTPETQAQIATLLRMQGIDAKALAQIGLEEPQAAPGAATAPRQP
jgi:hypothetical protein